MKALNNECAREAINFIYKHGDLTYGSAYDAIQLLTSNGFAIYRTDGDEQVVYTDPDGKVWHPHRGYWCWKVSHELAQAQRRIKELEAEPAPAARTGAVKVKALEWEDADEGMCTKWRAAALGGHYELVDFGKDDPGFAVNFHWGRPLSFWFIQSEPDEWGPTGPKIFPTLKAAKAAAQADYEHRILSALEPAAPEAQQEPVAWQEPELTCPHIERAVVSGELSPAVVDELAAIREINSQLRYGTWALKAQLKAITRPSDQAVTVTEAIVEAAYEKVRRMPASFDTADGDLDTIIRAALEALSAQNERLRKALEPFAKAGELFPGEDADFDQCIYKPAAGDGYALSGNHLRAARRALEGGE